MKQICILLLGTIVATAAVAQQATQLKDDREKVSYSIGLDIGSTFKKQYMDVDMDVLMRGLKDGMSGAKPAMSEEEVRATMTAYSKTMMEKQAQRTKESAATNLEKGQKFLEENKSKEGVKTTASGLQYKVLTEGNGPSPKDTDTVVTNYRGTTIDGKEFDSSYKRNEPATFPVNRVIKGWTEALQMMKVGSKYQLFIPAALAYGERGAGQDIGPNETLIFDVELVAIKPPTAPEGAQGADPDRPAASPAAGAVTSPVQAKPADAKASPAAKASPTAKPK
ncbi:MAG: FKBP-type peptidyl-prolyl cis-trans isomerase [Verrucomicrobiota bacterium]|nr:FKBP-type peptidyl-prolyl cis-trans isomerase [Verrucomicrobiota bacterium]